MKRSPALALLCLIAVLLPIPMVLVKPGWPPVLKADEPAYWLMAESLAYDFDLVLGEADRRRAFDSFPHGPIGNLIVMSDDGWRTLQYGKPYIYSLLAAPLVRPLGANAPLALNMALYLGMVWLGFRYLARHNSEGVAALMSAGFFLLSAGFGYIFWIQPEVLNMAAVTACLYLGLTLSTAPAVAGWRLRLSNPALRALLSGAALAPGVYNKPMLALLGLPVLFGYLRGRRAREGVYWIGGAVASMALVVGIFWGLTGLVTPYLGVDRGAVELCSPHEEPIPPAPLAPPTLPTLLTDAGEGAAGSLEPTALEGEGPPRASWAWIFHLPRLDARELAERFANFLWGRHTGLFLYFPFSLLALGLFLTHERRSPLRWSLLAATAAVALFVLLWIGHNWHGGGGFLGNRYFVNAYPALLFLVTRVTPFWLPLVGYGLGGLLLGPMLFSPFGNAVPWPTMQAHVRNAPFTLFPFELALENVPGYERRFWGGVQFVGRRDRFLPHGSGFWAHGAATTELWLKSWEEPVGPLTFRVRSPAVPNRVALQLGRQREVLTFGPGEGGNVRWVELAASRPTKIMHIDGQRFFVYRLRLTTDTGEARTWTRSAPPQTCDYFPHWDSWEESFYVGAEVLYVGDPGVLERDLYGVAWERALVPRQVEAGQRFPMRVRARNTSDAEWPAEPPIQVQLSYHWKRPSGEVVVWDGVRTPLLEPLAPGEGIARAMEVEAPDEPGTYELVLDLVLENVAWFSSRGGAVHRATVEVLPQGASSPEGGP